MPALWHTGMHTKRASAAHFGAQLSYKIKKGVYVDRAVTASQIENFYRKTRNPAGMGVPMGIFLHEMKYDFLNEVSLFVFYCSGSYLFSDTKHIVP